MAQHADSTHRPDFGYRADVDGLRAIAVLAVVVFHAQPSLVPGGFVGVDIFFVISGYLIGSLILSGLKCGTFSYLDFYRRRIRRLFPALALVLVTTWLLGLIVLLPADRVALGKQLIAAAGFAANILNFFEAGYFDLPAVYKPLLHIWSLGVEEQFYIVFPVLMVVLWRWRGWWLALTLIALASFALNIATVREHSSFAFYLPFTRFWEFVAGAVLAASLTARIASLPSSASANMLSIVGLAFVGAGIALAVPENFPGWMALLPVLGAALLIAAGPLAYLNRKILASPALVFVGLISYPLYLWHWPLIVLGRQWMSAMPNPRERTTALAAVAIAFVLAYLTWRLIEQPVRRQEPLLGLRWGSLRLAGGLAAAAVLGLITVQTYGFLFAYKPTARALLKPLTFSIEEEPFTPGSGPLLVTTGDSHAGHLLPGLRGLKSEQPFRFASTNWGVFAHCAPIGPPTTDADECRELDARNRAVFEQGKPEIVVIAAYWSYYRNIPALAAAIASFHRMGARRVVVIGPVPAWPRPPQALLFEAYRATGSVPLRLIDTDREAASIDAALRAIAASAGAIYVSARDVLCNAEGCLARFGDAASDIVQVDRTHLSDGGARWFVRKIAPQIFGE